MSFGARARINLSAIRHNLNIIRSIDPAARVMAVIKGNAYGHGMLESAAALEEADAFAVARISEAVRLREVGCERPLVLLGGVVAESDMAVAAITRRAEGYFIVHVESGEEGDYPLVNGQPIGAQARKLNDNDVVQLAGVKMGFFNG